jgi:2-methylisocitrate lyase-like PEP mutase family enzyme
MDNNQLKRKQLRQIIARQSYTIAPGAYDTLTARLVQLAGFEVVYLTGGGYARANGYPDIGLLTLPEVVRWIGLTVEAVDIPVIGDIDNGYGNAVNVVRAVREFEKAGVAGFHIEDQVAPKKCGHYEGKQIISPEEMVGKIKATVDTRQDPDMVIIARSDARAPEGLQAAIDRVNLYLEAGADMGFVEAPQSVEELATVARELRGPAVANVFEGGKTPVLPAATLERLGFRLGIYPSQTHRAAIFAAKEVLRVLKEHGETAQVEDRMVTFAEREEAVNAAHWRALEQQYLQIIPSGVASERRRW